MCGGGGGGGGGGDCGVFIEMKKRAGPEVRALVFWGVGRGFFFVSVL